MQNNNGVIKSVQKAIHIFKVLMNSEGELSISEIEKLTGYNASTIHHILKTMLEEGIISQNKANKKYELGPEIFGVLVRQKLYERFFSKAYPFLEKCAEVTGETTNIFIRDEEEAVCIKGYESKQTLRAYLMIGRRIPLTCTAVGKIFLAYMNSNDLKIFLQINGLKKYTPYTITDEKLFYEELKATIKRGYSIEKEEFEEMITAIGAPILDNKGNVIAAISTIVPSVRADEKRIQELGYIVKQTAAEISETLYNVFY
ncbi:IclR family transcriptional regulator [Thermovenabulum gondwanense]|uniref:HTH-type transcriptional repressor AllR n=1 Tax=Thermovenabulum gondwanense TaxID=520767 RepID=A0A162MNN3_9FIRM|nr:IclR family transcriptional regulator [Thermovenabulum gondwanense]KYO66801.1 HTH-type transcriptional repressor AllR [Thermovenabulum gondwanense]